MEQAIATLKELPGVFGVCVYNAEQKLIINHMPSFFPAATLDKLGKLITDIIALAREKLTNASDMTLHYDEVSLIVRALADKTILVIGEPHMNERMVSYSINILGKPKTTEDIEKNPAPAPTATPATPAAFFINYIPELKQGLAKIVGPMADIIFDDAMNAWQQENNAPFQQLLLILREDINNAQQYERYLELCAQTIAEIREREKLHG